MPSQNSARYMTASPRDYYARFDPRDESLQRVARTIYDFHKAGRALDLGCGPYPHLWGAFMPRCTQICASDLLQENIDVVEELRRHKSIAEPEKRALDLLKDFGHVPEDPQDYIYGRLGDVHTADVMTFNASHAGRMDTVIQIGCFGCLTRPQDFIQAAQHVKAYLKPSGRFISVSWVAAAGTLDTQAVSASMGSSSAYEWLSPLFKCLEYSYAPLKNPLWPGFSIFVGENAA